MDMSTVLEKQQARLKWLQHSCMMTNPNDYSLQSDSMPHFHGFFDNGDNVHLERQPETFLGSSDFSIGGSELFANEKMGFVRTDVAAHSTEIYYCLSRTSSCQVGMELGEAARMEEDVALMEETQSDNQRDSSNKRKAEYFAAEEFKGQVEVQSKVKEKTSTEISADSCKKNHKTSEVRKPDYIHVRARRGQATDSHSLAERARREKISKKMKCLQELVPGCNKITGRAGLLDEIINYIQSLQRQIEFLSMKLAAFAPRQELNADNISGKEYVASFPTATISPGVINMSQPEHNLVQEEAEAKNPTQAAPERTASSSVFIHELCLDSSCFSQVQPFWKPDTQDLHNMGFHKG